MKSANEGVRFVSAIAMGLLTLLLCLVIADGVLGIVRPPGGKNPVAMWIFCFFLLVFPIFFYLLTKWRDTLWNLLLYFLLYFPIRWAFGPKSTHYFLAPNQFLSDIFPVWVDALLIALLLWSVQSLVYLFLNSLMLIASKRKGK